jgi:hypothetical protein
VEVIDMLRVLARRRAALALALLFSIVVGVMVQYQVSLSPPGLSERVTTAHAAQTRVLLDAPEEPPTIDLDSPVADTLGLRAGLLADKMATDQVRSEIARRAGIEESELAVLPPASAPPPLPIPLAVAAADAARLTSEPYALSIAADPTVPIVRFVAGAPDTESAGRIANAAAASYEALVADGVNREFRLSVERLGHARTITTVDRMPIVVGPAVAIVLFALGAASIVLLAGIGRAWRAAAQPAG